MAVLAGVSALGAVALACYPFEALFEAFSAGAVSGPAFLCVAVTWLGLLWAGVKQLLPRGAGGKRLILWAVAFVVCTQLVVPMHWMDRAAVAAFLGGTLSVLRLWRLRRQGLS
jgi:hypothetical protein